MCVCDDFIEIKDVKPFKRLKRNNVSAGSVLYSSHNAVCFIVAVFFLYFYSISLIWLQNKLIYDTHIFHFPVFFSFFHGSLSMS